jgi:hypothetical protein
VKIGQAAPEFAQPRSAHGERNHDHRGKCGTVRQHALTTCWQEPSTQQIGEEKEQGNRYFVKNS